VLPWERWEQEVDRLRGIGAAFLAEPAFFHVGTSEEQAKFYLADPSHNIIEIKAYRDAAHTLGLPEAQA
jgi:extradiol dioxygenase family protein